jgi:hypothetical protein
MFLKYRDRLGLEPFMREVADSIVGPFYPVPSPSGPAPTTPMKITSRCGEAVEVFNGALIAEVPQVTKCSRPPSRGRT